MGDDSVVGIEDGAFVLPLSGQWVGFPRDMQGKFFRVTPEAATTADISYSDSERVMAAFQDALADVLVAQVGMTVDAPDLDAIDPSDVVVVDHTQ